DLAPHHLLALLGGLLDRRHRITPDHIQDEQENGQFDEERRVGEQEDVTALLGQDMCSHVRSTYGVAKTKTAMNARLMKDIASQRPTVSRKIVNSRPWASGCLATPAIVWAPAKPSPMAAPMAPPPSRMPPPMKAPIFTISLGPPSWARRNSLRAMSLLIGGT